MHRIGFMQGRLSPKPADRIQAFPKSSWREEFAHARDLGFDCIELIYDELDLEHNPLASDAGRRELVALSKESRVAVTSICADYFMVHPLVKNEGHAVALLSIAKEIGCPLVEFPFVDTSSLRQATDLAPVTKALAHLAAEARKLDLRIAVETDLAPVEFRNFLSQLPTNVGANLDLGNSAALGFDALSECRAFGARVFNVHIKDRMLGGTTVPLGTGNTDFERAFRGLKEARYREDFILQTCPDPNYLGIASQYRARVEEWIKLL